MHRALSVGEFLSALGWAGRFALLDVPITRHRVRHPITGTGDFGFLSVLWRAGFAGCSLKALAAGVGAEEALVSVDKRLLLLGPRGAADEEPQKTTDEQQGQYAGTEP